ncbi:MAG: HD domain-containing protein [Ruminococcaceae bacterium]|nr:HD domain-containing protein [Oscillospiraceae bacterium]
MKNKEAEKILRLIPTSGEKIEWAAFENTVMRPIFSEMARTEQNPVYHGEIDVLSHTKMVCEALIRESEYQNGNKKEKTALFLAALFHDIGKIKCTFLDEGIYRSPNHARIGSVITREILWRDFGFCGNEDVRELRETVCQLVRYHSFPPYAMSDADAERKILKISSNGELIRSFSFSQLLLLEKADILGRIAEDTEESLEKLAYCRMLADEIGCTEKTFPFADTFSERAYFKGKTEWKEQSLFSDAWGEVILLSGLPGTGKDTWISKNFPELSIVSLDDIRKKLGILPKENQGRVIAAGYEAAKELLRKKQPFIWNATNITSKMRGALISLFEDYGASVKTVFLETEWEEQLRRNAEREARVPVSAIERMLGKLELPERFESERVVWEIV